MRIFIGPTEIAGMGEGLRRGFLELGHECDVITAAPHPFAYGDKKAKSNIVRIWQWFGSRVESPNRNKLQKIPFYLFKLALSWLVLFRTIPLYDSYIFLFGSTLTNTELELMVLKIFKKKIIVCYVGSDARPPYMDGGKFQPPFSSKVMRRVHKKTQQTARLVALHERYADQIVSNHGLCHFSQRKLVNWFYLGIPTPEHAPHPNEVNLAQHRTILALHSPSNQAVKGTKIIEDVVSKLQKKGIPIELKLIKNVQNSVVLDEIAKCDFVIDQIYSDTPMAGFATEAARFGKPAIVGGYFATEVAQYIPSKILPPSEFVHPELLGCAIQKMATDQNYREQLGKKAKQFVNEQWSSKCVAERYLNLLMGTVPHEWYFDPRETTYIRGCGLSEKATTELITEMIQGFGIKSLQVKNKPDLEQKLLNVAGVSFANESSLR